MRALCLGAPVGSRPLVAARAAAAVAACRLPGLAGQRLRQRFVPRGRQQTLLVTNAATSPAIHRITGGDSSSEEAAPPPPAATTSNAWRLALATLRPDWPLLLATTVSLTGTILFTLLFPLAIGEVFDVVRAQGGLAAANGAAAPAVVNPFQGLGGAAASPTSFRAALAKLAGCLVLSATGNALVSYFSTLLGERFAHRLKGRLMETIMARPQSFFDASTKGDLVSRLTVDVTVLQTTLADFIGQRGFRSMFEVLGALLFIGLQQPLLALVSFAITPALSRLLRSVVVRSSAIIYRRQQVAAEALEFAGERLAQVQTVQVFAQERREADAFARLSASGYSMAERYAVFQGIVEGSGRLAVNVGTVALLGLGGLLVLQGRISVGALLAVNVFNLFISVGLSAVAASFGELGKAVGALERIADLVAPPGAPTADAAAAEGSKASSSSSSSEAAAAHAAAPGAAAPDQTSSSSSHVVVEAAPGAAASTSGRVELRDVWFKYPGAGDWAVRGLNLTIEPGQTLALVGPSGGGKSTIAALLLGLYTPQRGDILIDGRPLGSSDDAAGGGAAAAGMAAVLQQPMLMSGSVRQQISYGKPDASIEEIAEAARAAHADEFVEQLPQGYDTEVGERGHALSGGQKQRLAIARALLLHPKILVLDEVTSALDVASERAISDTLRHLAATKLIIAHRLSTVRRADSIAVIVDGSVAEQGSHAELLALGGRYAQLINTAELGAYWVQGASDSSSSSDEGDAPAVGEQPVAAAAAATSL
ncbi:ABC transporter B family member 28 isoform X2 [Chlorella sorokiniana]|uniref:ABC transporter B family member 28 isoform X2 n=1 Tax=Chlorella sorokiniana TaxID=3076 RepID=A0A2P6U139_CHLSO|nr:ABC transporter B family member 28 isoform X2 [Chlorella sorokiniana]|eukprot:PRW60036.1 ABC transporter B family member 28 isoform X2 [Chlorella sorokiniana]